LRGCGECQRPLPSMRLRDPEALDYALRGVLEERRHAAAGGAAEAKADRYRARHELDERGEPMGDKPFHVALEEAQEREAIQHESEQPAMRGECPGRRYGSR